MRKTDLRSNLRPGSLYRRADLKRFSNSVDRELAKLVEEQVLVKVQRGIYECPKRSRYGVLPPDQRKLVKIFLKSDHFLLTSPNEFNALGVGTTQLYNHLVVYNHKRHGRFVLAGQVFEFRIKPNFPKRVTTEFLLVELINDLDSLAEDREAVRSMVRTKLLEMSSRRFRTALKRFPKVSTRKFFEEVLYHCRLQKAAAVGGGGTHAKSRRTT